MPNQQRPVRAPFPRKNVGQDDDDEGDMELATGRQCLPMASLGGDFSGVPMNGEEYLAMMHKQYRSLPWITAAPNPYKATHFANEQTRTGTDSRTRNGNAGGTTSSTAPARHRALPTESWQTSFDQHFKNYRRYIQENKAHMPRASMENIPHPSNQSYINGVRRKRIHKSKISQYPEILAALQAQQLAKSDEQQVESDLDVPDNSKTEQMATAEPEEEMMNEEEAMNEEDMMNEDTLDWAGDDCNGEEEEVEEDEAVTDGEDDNDEDGEMDQEKYFLEPEQEKHRSREPILPLLAAFSQWRLHRTLSHINAWISDSIDIYATELVEDPSDAPKPPSSIASPTPLTPLYARWIFSCLLFLDEHLSADQMSDLRNLAKTCVKLVIWQVATGRVGPDGQGMDERQEEMKVSAWMIHRAICGGWAQRDLLEDAESMLAQLV